MVAILWLGGVCGLSEAKKAAKSVHRSGLWHFLLMSILYVYQVKVQPASAAGLNNRSMVMLYVLFYVPIS